VAREDGFAYERNGHWYWGVYLRDDRKHRRPAPPLPDGSPAQERHARALAAAKQRAYDAGQWDPDAPPPPAPERFGAYVLEWLGKQTYETAKKEKRAAERYLADCPVASVPVRDLRPRHGIELVEHLKSRPSKRGDTIGYSAVVSTFNACERALDRAVVDEVLAANPFRIDAVHKILPDKKDKVPGARAGWRFTPAELVALTTSPLLKPDRRVLNALVFWTGMRPGEFRALRVRDLDLELDPLGRITLARAIKSVTRAEGETKTGAIKDVPVLPPLAAVLREWLERGWRDAMKRGPEANDLVIPSVRGRARGMPRNESAANRAFKADQVALGISKPKHERHLYCARHTLVRMLRDAGARREVVKWATHAPPRSVYDGYADAPAWDVLCAEFEKLLQKLPAEVTSQVTPAATAAEKPVDSPESRRKHRGIERSDRVSERRGSSPKVLPFRPRERRNATAGDTSEMAQVTRVTWDEEPPLDPGEAARRCEGELWSWHDRELAEGLGGAAARGRE
jgi:integrase